MTRDANKQNGQKSRRAMTEPERLMVERLDRFPLASAYDIAGMCGDGYKPCHETLQNLEYKGRIGGMAAGCSQRRQHRYWNNARRAGRTADNPQPKQPKLIHSLLQRITLTESVYLIIEHALAAKPKRTLRELYWRFDPAVDATVRFNDGWMAFKWSGIWQSPRLLTEYLEHLDDNLRAWRPDGDQPSPGRICFVVPDAWQAELVRRAVADFDLRERCLIFNADSQEIEGDYDYDLSQSRRWPPPPDMARWNRSPDRLDDIMRRLMERGDARALVRCLSTIEQWPGVPRSVLRDFTRLNGRSVTTSLATLGEMDLMQQMAHGGSIADDAWLSIAGRRDRVWSGRPGAGSEILQDQLRRTPKHEIGLMELVGWFAAAGCPVAPGWRFRDVMGEAGQTAPDAMIYIKNSPFGPTWFYLEYELSAKSASKCTAKMHGYRSPQRGDDYPVLVVCRRMALPHFQRACTEIPTLIAPIEDVRRNNVIGNSGTLWRRDGQPVSRLAK